MSYYGQDMAASDVYFSDSGSHICTSHLEAVTQSTTHTHTRSLAHTRTLSLSHTLTHTHAPSHTLTHTHTLTHSHTLTELIKDKNKSLQEDMGPRRVIVVSICMQSATDYKALE